jgi:hypothetical protein
MVIGTGQNGTWTFAERVNRSEPATISTIARVVALPPGGGVPGGVARLYIDGVYRGAVTLDGSGVGTWVIAGGLSVGRHVARVVYDGDGNYLGSSVTESWDFVIGRNT